MRFKKKDAILEFFSNNRKLSRTSFQVLVLFEIIIAIMSNHTCEPFMCWETPNLVESLKFFKRPCELFFSVKGIAENKQVDHILLLS